MARRKVKVAKKIDNLAKMSPFGMFEVDASKIEAKKKAEGRLFINAI